MKNIKYINIFKGILSVFLFGFLATKLDFTSLSRLNIASFLFIVVAIVVTLSTLMVMSFRWSLLCNSLKINISLFKLYKFYLKSSFYNIFLPGAIGGDVVRTKDLMNTYSVSVKKASSITIVERFSGLYMLLVMLVFGITFLGIPKEIILPFDKQYFTWILVLILLCIPFLKWLINKKVKINYGTILPVLLTSFLGQLGDVFIAWLFCIHFNVSVGFEQLLIIMPLVYFATVLPISLGGLGVRESVFVGLLSLYSVSAPIAVLISFMMYFTKVLVGIIGWVIFVTQKYQTKILEV